MRLWEEGARICFRCECPLRGDGIYKVWITGNTGEMLLGTLIPEGGMLMLFRTVSRDELLRCGCWPVRAARCTITYSFKEKPQADHWYWEDAPDKMVNEETRVLSDWRRMLCRKCDNYFELACPLKNGAALPMSHLFCFAYSRRIRGDLYLVWRFDWEGRPVFS